MPRLFIFALLLCSCAFAQTPQWIWHSQTSAPTVFFRKTFRTPPLLWNARLTASADEACEIYLNGVLVAACRDWRQPLKAEVSVRLNQGENVIAARARNAVGPAGLLVHLNLLGETNLVSDDSWLVSTNEESNWTHLAFSAARWSRAKVLAAHGADPWGDVLFRAAATPGESIKVVNGFKVELLRSAEPNEGSWICAAFDDRGRLIVSPEGDSRPLLRMTLVEGRISKVEPVPAPIRYAMGLLQTDHGLYANARGPEGSGLYLLRDTDSNDRYDPGEVQLIKRFEGGSEHGYHALSLGPDRRIYILNGNGTRVPDGLSPASPHRNYAEDALSGSRAGTDEDEGSKAPNCYVLRYDPATREFDLFAGGIRNAYDFDFNGDGELFTFDSDMEWDWGTPWYKPTRILHIVSGGEYGWRDGTRMWADHYEDALPPVTYIGIGSPTGVKFGTRSNFPDKYRRALYAMDWSYGRILALHLERNGSSYAGRWETFLEGRPLNLTSLAFGPDGAMYFVTGGRATQSGLYRVQAVRPAETARGAGENTGDAVRLRRRLESFHGRDVPESLSIIWPALRDPDRFIRFAASAALESQNPNGWRERALEERDPEIALQALRCLTRVSGRDIQEPILQALAKFAFNSLSEPLQLRKLRCIEISIARNGKPRPETVRRLVQELSPSFPASEWALNAELSRILLRLEAPGAVARSVDLLTRAATQEQQVHYIEQLRNVRSGWTLEDRRRFLAWFSKPRHMAARSADLSRFFKDVGREYVDGAFFDKYLRDFRREAVATLSHEEREALEPVLVIPIAGARNVPVPAARPFVREWKLADLLPELDRPHTANLARGRQAFVDAQCITCHRFGNDGGLAGPELTGAANKYSRRDLLEAILEPSKVISEQYQDHTVLLKDGELFSGRLVAENDKEIVLETDRINADTQRFPRADVVTLRPASLSVMPEGLVNILTREEILDLLAYLGAGASSGF